MRSHAKTYHFPIEKVGARFARAVFLNKTFFYLKKKIPELKGFFKFPCFSGFVYSFAGSVKNLQLFGVRSEITLHRENTPVFGHQFGVCCYCFCDLIDVLGRFVCGRALRSRDMLAHGGHTLA